MYKKVLVPLDGSKLAECAVNHVQSLCKEGSIGSVTLLNLVKVEVPWHRFDLKDFNIVEIREKSFKSSRKYLADVKSRLSAEGIKVKTESIEAERPVYAIIDYAQNNGMDLIVIATHGITGMKRMLLGSVAFGVLHQSHVPVLLVRPESCQP
ncbi:MAG: universal stress protein [Deltaproteobacteria bacterium]|nr:MAG: universal stress protein [Deltaproteobacteria bacterium]